MASEYQKVRDIIITNLVVVLSFVDNTLVLTKGTRAEQLKKRRIVLRTLDEANMQLNVVILREIGLNGFGLSINSQ